MSDKLPSPWSAEFYEANTVKKLSRDEIQHAGVKGMKWDKVKDKFKKTIDNLYTSDQEQADAFVAQRKTEEMAKNNAREGNRQAYINRYQNATDAKFIYEDINKNPDFSKFTQAEKQAYTESIVDGINAKRAADKKAKQEKTIYGKAVKTGKDQAARSDAEKKKKAAVLNGGSSVRTSGGGGGRTTK